MKPFNLEEAKAGKAVVTRDGREVRFIAHVPEANESQQVIVLVANSSNIAMSHEDGRIWGSFESELDLFMAPEKVSGWMNLYRDNMGGITGGAIYPAKEEAMRRQLLTNGYCIGTSYVELEV